MPFLKEREKPLRNINFEYRYMVTPFDSQDNSLDSEWVSTKSEAQFVANRMLRSSDVAYVECDNRLNRKLSFRVL
jgi:hypothetical protein